MALDKVAEDLNIQIGSMLGTCHKVEAFLGQGGFGFVTQCLNTETGENVAIKVNKDTPTIFHQAKVEIGTLKKLRCLDPDTSNIVRWNGFFFHKENICLTFELLDQSLSDFLYDRYYEGISTEEVKPVVHQLASALCHLKSVGLIHADLKPQNIMVANPYERPLRVKVIDFGLALPPDAARPGMCLQTTPYRAPEMILHIPFDEGIDMWGLGLTAAELVLGDLLYPGYTEYDVLSLITQTQGQPEDHVLDRGWATKCFFQHDYYGFPRWRFLTQDEFVKNTGTSLKKTGTKLVGSLDEIKQVIEAKKLTLDRSDHLLVDLIKRMLELDPRKRITAVNVLKHPFFAQSIPAPGESPEVSQHNIWVDRSDRVRQESESSWKSLQSQSERPEIHKGFENPAFADSDLSHRSRHYLPMEIDHECMDTDEKPSELSDCSFPRLSRSEGSEDSWRSRHSEAQRPEYQWEENMEHGHGEQASCYSQSSRDHEPIVVMGADDETSELHQTPEPEGTDCRVSHICMNMTDMEDRSSEVKDETINHGQSLLPHVGIDMPDIDCSFPRLSIDVLVSPSEGPEDSWQSRHSDTQRPEHQLEENMEASCYSQSSRDHGCVLVMGADDETPELHQTPEPAGTDCRVSHICMNMTDMEDRSSEFEDETINLGQSFLPHVGINMPDTDCSFPCISIDMLVSPSEGSEDSWQSCHSDTQRPNHQCEESMEASCYAQSSRDHECIMVMGADDETSELHQTPEPEGTDCRVSHICMNMTDMEDRSSEFEDETINLGQRLLPHVCIDMPDIDFSFPHISIDMSDSPSEGLEDSQTPEPGGTDCRDHICINMTDIEDTIPQNNELSLYQPAEPGEDNEGWLWWIVGRIKATVSYFFPVFG